MKTSDYLLWLYIAVCVAYGGYEAYTYSGLYRLAAEWQMDQFGSYDERLTFLAPVVVLVIPGGIVAQLLGVKKVNGLESLTALTQSPRFMLAAGLVMAAVAAGAGWYAYGKETEKVDFAAFDLSKSNTPPSNHVVMTGVAHTEYQVEFETKRNSTTTVDRYIPVTAAEWRSGDALVYFIKTNATEYTPPEGGRSFAFSRRTPPFPVTTRPGTLVEGDLPGPVAEVYRKNNVALAPSPVVLHAGVGADAEPYIFVAVFGAMGWIFCWSTAARMAFRRWRQARA